MATVETVARSALAAIAIDANLALAGQWVNERLAEAASLVRFRYLRRFGSVQIPAALGAGNTSGVPQGLVTATRDSDVIVGDADAHALWDQTLIGRYVKVTPRVAWYKIVGVDNSGNLHIEVPFSEDSVSGVTYNLVARQVPIVGARHIGPAVYQRFRWPLDRVTLESLNYLCPERQYFSYGPTMYAEVGEDEQGEKLIEFYPYSAKSEVVNFVVWDRPASPPLEGQLPGAIDTALLKQGVMIDAMRYAASVAAQKNQLEQAVYWRNEYRAQETKWSRVIDALAMTDNGTDDQTFILQMGGAFGAAIGRDIRNAYDFVFAQGNRP